ncbi:UNVERIFIED_CONTAM: hypothetical protein Sradi_7267900, partial [Sesamum radiatum]
VPNDGTRSCPLDAGPSSYCYGGGLYDYDESGLPDPFFNIVHAADQPLWDGCTQSQLGVVAELVDIKTDGHISDYSVRTYDHATDRAFIMRAALMWTVNDLPAYRMASRWSTEGVMGYLICMDDTRAFHLQHGRKACYFDCHRQFLPTHHSYRRNKKAFKKNRVKNKVARPRLTKARSSI